MNNPSREPSHWLSVTRTSAILTCAFVVGTSCGGATADVVEVESAAILDGQAPLTKRAAMETLGLRPAGSDERPAAAEFDFDMPDGWTALGKTQFRRVNLRFGPADDPGQCYLVTLPGGGGTLTDNVNRWRNQLGKEPLDRAAVLALPRRKLPRLGAEATIVDLRGSYGGMDGKPRPGRRFIGWIWREGRQGHYLVCVGPEELIDTSLAAFEAFAMSLRPRGNERQEPASSEETFADLLEYDLPESWSRERDRPMRVFNFDVGERSSCYVARAGGSALANINRWRGQLGAPALTSVEISRLPLVKILGSDAVVVEVRGDFGGGMGADEIADAMLLGAIGSFRGTSLFVKMLGPENVIEAQRENFLAFCRSIRTKSDEPGEQQK